MINLVHLDPIARIRPSRIQEQPDTTFKQKPKTDPTW